MSFGRSRYQSMDDFTPSGRSTRSSALSAMELSGMGGMGGMGMGGGIGLAGIQQELANLKQETELIKGMVQDLEGEGENLRQGIRKLKVENSRMKQRMKKVAAAAGAGDMEVDDFDDIDFDTLKEFLLVGGNPIPVFSTPKGPQDPFALRFEADIKDGDGKEHKSSERYLWYKMAETFGDMDAAEKIRSADVGSKAEEEMGKIKNFDEAAWNVVKMKYWEEGQKLKMDQVRWIQSLLVYSDKVYIAIAGQDKVWATGWRKQRQESGQPKLWDGENEGGKALMRMRETYKAGHSWNDDEEKETKKKYDELKRTYWRRPSKDDNNFGGGRGGGRGRGTGGRGGRYEGGRGEGGRENGREGRGRGAKRGRY